MVVIAKSLASRILPSIYVILVLKYVFLTRPLVSGILFSISDLSVSYLVFKTNVLVSILITLAANYHRQFFNNIIFYFIT